jgi:uncharacterized membrane protein
MLTLLAYTCYVKVRGAKHYILCLLAFSLSLMAKPMSVTLPVVLLLLDYWPLRRVAFSTKWEERKFIRLPSVELVTVRKLALEKIPFFLISAASCVITILAQGKSGAIRTLDSIPLSNRIFNAITVYFKYLYMGIFPFNLQVIYPFPTDIQVGAVILCSFFIIVTILFSLYLRNSAPYLLVGLMWYLVTLIPVIGIVQVGLQSMADRYTYIPLIGFFISVS